jgi:hypothetical protein
LLVRLELTDAEVAVSGVLKTVNLMVKVSAVAFRRFERE